MGGLVDYTWKLFGTIEVVDRVGGYIHQAQMADFDWFTVKSVFFGTKETVKMKNSSSQNKFRW